jgi:hypothetical protein
MLFATIPGVSAEALGRISDRGGSADGTSCLGNCCLGNSGGGIIQEQRTSKGTVDSISFMRTSSRVFSLRAKHFRTCLKPFMFQQIQCLFHHHNDESPIGFAERAFLRAFQVAIF